MFGDKIIPQGFYFNQFKVTGSVRRLQAVSADDVKNKSVEMFLRLRQARSGRSRSSDRIKVRGHLFVDVMMPIKR